MDGKYKYPYHVVRILIDLIMSGFLSSITFSDHFICPGINGHLLIVGRRFSRYSNSIPCSNRNKNRINKSLVFEGDGQTEDLHCFLSGSAVHQVYLSIII